ncbi:hypothetical protein AB0W38_00520 [Aliarcobacter butzleri]|uniref:hypothetical protein n=1 Tax=Aliarcobacter butzleri TaxID=28197 RepID=UPI00344DF335
MKKIIATTVLGLSLLTGVASATNLTSSFDFKVSVDQKSYVTKNGDLVLNVYDLNEIRLYSLKQLNCKDKDLEIIFAKEDGVHIYVATCASTPEVIVNPIF